MLIPELMDDPVFEIKSMYGQQWHFVKSSQDFMELMDFGEGHRSKIVCYTKGNHHYLCLGKLRSRMTPDEQKEFDDITYPKIAHYTIYL